MKSLLTIITAVILFVASAFTVNAQDSTVVTKYYAGVLSSASWDSTGKVTSNTTSRAAIELSTQLFGFEFWGRGVWRSQGGSFAQGWISKSIGSVKLSAGLLPRPMTLMTRPNPVTPGGHFEPPAKSVIPGSTTGFRMDYAGKFTASFGLHYLENSKQVEVGAAFSFFAGSFEFRTGGFYSPKGYGASFTTVHKLFSVQGYLEKDSIGSVFAGLNTPVAPYLTWVYNHKGHYSKNLEIGVTKDIEAKKLGISGLIGFGYQMKPVKSYNLYLFVHLP